MKRTTLTWVGLLVLTGLSAGLSLMSSNFVILGILLLAALKFIGVAFNFMELRKAHSFWKAGILMYLVFLILLIMLILN